MGYPAGLPPRAIPNALPPHEERRERCNSGPAANRMAHSAMKIIKWCAHVRICVQKICFLSWYSLLLLLQISTLMAYLRKCGMNSEGVNLKWAGYAAYYGQDRPTLPFCLTEHMATSLNASASILTRRELCATLMASLLLQVCSSCSCATPVNSALLRHSPHGEPRPTH
jgi:hypothetical protein